MNSGIITVFICQISGLYYTQYTSNFKATGSRKYHNQRACEWNNFNPWHTHTKN